MNGLGIKGSSYSVRLIMTMRTVRLIRFTKWWTGKWTVEGRRDGRRRWRKSWRNWGRRGRPLRANSRILKDIWRMWHMKNGRRFQRSASIGAGRRWSRTSTSRCQIVWLSRPGMRIRSRWAALMCRMTWESNRNSQVWMRSGKYVVLSSVWNLISCHSQSRDKNISIRRGIWLN